MYRFKFDTNIQTYQCALYGAPESGKSSSDIYAIFLKFNFSNLKTNL